MNEPLQLTIDDLGAQGDGIAHSNGHAIFVAGTLAGETAIGRRSSEPSRVELLNIIAPSTDRAPLSCSHFPQCGGCRLQHYAIAPYTAWKISQLRLLLSQHGLNNVEMLPPFVAAPRTRRRVRMAASHHKGIVTLGFNAWRSSHVINITDCAVILPMLMNFITALREQLGRWLPVGSGCDVQITALPGGLDVVLIGGPALGVDQRMELAMLAEALDIGKLSWRKWDRSALEPVAYRKPLTVQYNDVAVPFPPGSFLQATAVSERILTAFATTALDGCTKVLDLFSGLGAFGLSLRAPAHVTFSDSDGPAMQALDAAIKAIPRYRTAKKNLLNNPFMAEECNAFDAVIFDPPRGGAKAQAVQLAKSEAQNVIAVSCDPASFTRDAKILLDGGYKLKSLLPVDQFLWSTHMEVAAHFTR